MDVGARARVSHLPATCCKGTPIFTFRPSHGGPETASLTSESLSRELRENSAFDVGKEERFLPDSARKGGSKGREGDPQGTDGPAVAKAHTFITFSHPSIDSLSAHDDFTHQLHIPKSGL